MAESSLAKSFLNLNLSYHLILKFLSKFLIPIKISAFFNRASYILREKRRDKIQTSTLQINFALSPR